jgi:hypothetical protein
MGADPRFTDNFDDYSFEEKGKPATRPMSVDEIDAEASKPDPSALRDYFATLDKESVPGMQIARSTDMHIARDPGTEDIDFRHEGTRARQVLGVTHPNDGHDAGWNVGASGSAARALSPREAWQTTGNKQTLAGAMDEAAPLDGQRPDYEHQELADVGANSYQHSRPEPVYINYATAAAQHADRAKLGLPVDQINAPGGARDRQEANVAPRNRLARAAAGIANAYSPQPQQHELQPIQRQGGRWQYRTPLQWNTPEQIAADEQLRKEQHARNSGGR